MWSWIVGKIISPFLPYILGALIAAGLVGSVASYFKGRSDMNAIWVAKNDKAVIDAQAKSIDNYRKAAEEAKAQLAKELQVAQADKSLIEERMKQVEADNSTLEAQIAEIVPDKEKANVVVKIIRAQCNATGADVALDQRLRRQHEYGTSGVPPAVVPKPRPSIRP